MTPQRTLFRGLDGPEIDRKRAIRLADVQRYAPRYVGTFRRAYAGGSLRAAVTAQCVECMGFEVAAVRECTAPACPLWPYRPGWARERRRHTEETRHAGADTAAMRRL